MSRIAFSLLALAVACISARAAESLELALRSVRIAAQTNLPLALALCDKVVADFPSNAQPLSVRARLLDASRRYHEGVRDLTVALKLEPRQASLWQGRGELNFKAGRFADSVADFDHVIELSPQQAPHHWQRGISLYYAKRYSDGRKQFESHRSVNPNDVENAVWHFLCVAKESGVTNARAVILPVGPDSRVPMREIDLLFRGQGTVSQVLESASKNPARGGKFYANLYLGLYFDALGEAAKAREYIRLAATDPTSEHYMGEVARVHWKLLQDAKR